jgi:hypothetical protein
MDPNLKAQLDAALDKVNADPRVDLASMALYQAIKHPHWHGAIEWAKKVHGEIVWQVGKEMGYEGLFLLYQAQFGQHYPQPPKA